MGRRRERPHGRDARRFEIARRLMRFHYQWLVVNDWLRTIPAPGIVDKLRSSRAPRQQFLDVHLGATQRLQHRHPLQRIAPDVEDDRVP